MANIVGSEREEFQQSVRVKYIPISGTHKGVPFVTSITSGTGKHVSVSLKPNTWQKVPVEIARQLQMLVKKSKRNKIVPSGDQLELQMEKAVHDERVEMQEPDFEILVDGNI